MQKLKAGDKKTAKEAKAMKTKQITNHKLPVTEMKNKMYFACSKIIK